MLVYLASPYSGTPEQEESRFQQVAALAAEMMNARVNLFCAIAHSHPIAVAGGLPRDWEFWQRYDEEIIALCGHLVVATEIEGWDKSKGVAAEVEIAVRLGVAVTYGVRKYLRELEVVRRVMDGEAKWET
jgi:hypothetical protein